MATGSNDSNNKTILRSHLPSACHYENAVFSLGMVFFAVVTVKQKYYFVSDLWPLLVLPKSNIVIRWEQPCDQTKITQTCDIISALQKFVK